ncbi:MAG: Lead, cadmium, zinc and mercury transporting ATPase; Copper-translocating P-type ATPase, partial [uncultured Gemmatimonadetes bacterium]
ERDRLAGGAGRHGRRRLGQLVLLRGGARARVRRRGRGGGAAGGDGGGAGRVLARPRAGEGGGARAAGVRPAGDLRVLGGGGDPRLRDPALPSRARTHAGGVHSRAARELRVHLRDGDAPRPHHRGRGM